MDERDPTGPRAQESEWHHWELDCTTSFNVEGVTPRGAGATDVLVWGEYFDRDWRGDGRFVIEHWTMEYPRGAPHPARPVGKARFGVPAPIPQTRIEVPPEYVPPAQRRPEGPLRRLVIQGPMDGELLDVAYDPSGQFALALIREEARSQVLRIPVTTDGAPVILADETGFPFLAECRSLFYLEYPKQGSVVSATPPFPYDKDDRVLFIDADNDGRFERIRHYEDWEWKLYSAFRAHPRGVTSYPQLLMDAQRSDD